jgi:hypothetical protein
MWTYPENWAIENMATETAQGVKTFQTLLNKGVTPLNASVDLPVTLSSSIPRAAIVGRAALTIFNVAGLGLTAYSLYNLLSDNGLSSDGSITNGTVSGCYHPGNSLCPSIGTQSAPQTCISFAATVASAAISAGCWAPANTYTTSSLGGGRTLITFKRNTTSYGSTEVQSQQVPNVINNPTIPQLENQITPANTATNKQLFDALKEDSSKGTAGSSFPFFVMNTAVTDIVAEPYVSPSQVVSTETVPMPDGSTQTISIEEAYSYYPTLSGIDATTGLVTSTPVQQNPFTGQLEPVELNNLEPGSQEIDYQSITQTQTTTTNNTTGQTSTTTTQTNHGTGQTTIINNTTNNTNTDICQANPAILACQTLGTATPPEPVEVPTHEIETTFEPPASVPGQCPQPIVRTLSNGQTEITYDYDKLCEMATSLRPFVILFSLLGAAYYVSTGIKSRAFV